MALLYCIACSNNSRKKPQYSYFRFPLDDKRCDLWKEGTGIDRLMEYTPEECYKRFVLCSAHFQSKDFAGMSRSKLKRDAVPSIFNNKPMVPVTELGLSFLDASSRLITSCRQVCAVKSCSNTNDDLNVTLYRFPTSSIVDNQLDTCKGLIFQDHIYAKTETGQNNFGTRTEENVANDNFCDKDDISYISTSVSAPSSNSTETCQHLDNNENIGGSACHSIMNCKLDADDCVLNEDTPPLWHFNNLPERQGFMEVNGDRPQRLRWFELRYPSVT